MEGKHRNRSQGWEEAKKSGHINEDMVKNEILKNKELQNRILKIAYKENRKIKDIDGKGINEKDIPCVLGGKTKSKSDIKIILDNNETIGISIKKSLAGQVYLIGVERFIEGYEKQYVVSIPDDVKYAIKLFWGDSNDVDGIIQKFSDGTKNYEIRKHRIVATTLEKYSKDLYQKLIEWFNDNIINIFDFCFSKGLTDVEDEWANIIWYKNDVGAVDADVMINIEDAKRCLKENCIYGNRNGGTTIKLPFGTVEWHSPKKTIPGNMQFHHKYEDIMSAIEEYCKENDIIFDKHNPTSDFENKK